MNNTYPRQLVDVENNVDLCAVLAEFGAIWKANLIANVVSTLCRVLGSSALPPRVTRGLQATSLFALTNVAHGTVGDGVAVVEAIARTTNHLRAGNCPFEALARVAVIAEVCIVSIYGVQFGVLAVHWIADTRVV